MSSTERASVVDVFVARQPIFDDRGELHAYELLYRRNAAVGCAEGTTADVMASEVLVHTFLNIGIERMTGGAKAFLNFTREMLLDGVWQLFDPKQVVIEVLETVTPDDEVVAACRTLVEAGYTLALDDFEYQPAFEPLLHMASVVKLDVLGKDAAAISASAKQLAPYRAVLLAERVETHEVQAVCRSLGFRYFQGYFFSRPEVLVRRDLSAGQLAILRLMNLLRNTASSDRDLEDAFRTDVSLTYKLLRTVNSAALGGRGIESIVHAVRLVGRIELHKWLSLLLVTSVASAGGMTGELVRTALRRARMCELVALDRGDRRGSEALFIVGLFSLLDAILKVPMAELLERLDLASEVRRALLVRSGPFASTLSLVEAYERGTWDAVAAEAAVLDIAASRLADLYLASIEWTRERLDGE